MRLAARWCLVALLLSVTPALATHGREVRHPDVAQTWRLLPDRAAEVEDDRAWQVRGVLPFASLSIPTDGADVRVAGVWEGANAVPYHTWLEPGRRVVRWATGARDETRRYVVRYLVTPAVTVAPEGALFDRSVLDDDHAEIDELTVRIALPGHAASPPRVSLSGGGGGVPTAGGGARVQGSLSIAPDVVTVTQMGVWAATPLRIRVVMDPGLFR